MMLTTCYDPRRWRASGISTTSLATKHIKTAAGRYSRYVILEDIGEDYYISPWLYIFDLEIFHRFSLQTGGLKCSKNPLKIGKISSKKGIPPKFLILPGRRPYLSFPSHHA